MDKTNQNQQSKERDIGDLYFFFPYPLTLTKIMTNEPIVQIKSSTSRRSVRFASSTNEPNVDDSQNVDDSSDIESGQRNDMYRMHEESSMTLRQSVE